MVTIVKAKLTPAMITAEAYDVARKRLVKRGLTPGPEDIYGLMKSCHHSVFSQAKRNLERRVLGIYERRKRKA